MQIENRWMNSPEVDVYNELRSGQSETIAQAMLGDALKVEVGRNVKWKDTTGNGEIDLALSSGNTGYVVECKSHQSPLKQSAAVSDHPADQLASLDEAIARDSNLEFAGRDSALVEAAVRQRHQSRLVILGSDYSTRTSALSYGVASRGTNSPLYLSVPDLGLLCSMLGTYELALYLMVRYFHRREQLGVFLDEEVFLAAFLRSGAVDGMEEHLKTQLTTPNTRDRYGPIHEFLAWRNTLAAFEPELPAMPELYTPEAMRPLISAVRRSPSADPWIEYLIRWCWSEVFELFCTRAAIPVPSPVPRTWFSLQDPRGVFHQVGIGFGDVPSVRHQLLREAAGEVNKQLRLLDPDSKLVVVTMVWSPLSGECQVDYLTDAHAVLHPPLDFSRTVLARKSFPERNQPCYCGSGKKRKLCERTHHPECSQLLRL
jgi:hypothetical protein